MLIRFLKNLVSQISITVIKNRFLLPSEERKDRSYFRVSRAGFSHATDE